MAIIRRPNTNYIPSGAITIAKADNSSLDAVDVTFTVSVDGATLEYASGVIRIMDGGVTTAKLADSSVTSAKIVDGTIVDADVNAAANVAPSKLSHPGTTNVFLRGDATWAATITIGTSDPVSPTAGQSYLNTATSQYCIWSGTHWYRVTMVPSVYVGFGAETDLGSAVSGSTSGIFFNPIYHDLFGSIDLTDDGNFVMEYDFFSPF